MSLVIPVFIPHRGCPHQCLFCNQESITGRSERDEGYYLEVARSIEMWLERSRATENPTEEVEVAFYGGSFTCLPQQEQKNLLGVVQPFIKEGRVQSIRLSTRPDCISDDIASFLLAFGVKKVELGVQSLCVSVLRKSQRGHSVEDSVEAIAILKKAGFKVGVQLMAGLPGETTASFLRGVDTLITLAPDFVRLYPVLVVRHSGLEKAYEEGRYTPLSLNKAIALGRIFRTRIEGAGITVIRMGLQPTDELSDMVVAGPYHPSFGELVQSRIWLGVIRKRLVLLKKDETVVLHISHRDLSAVQGIRKCNIKRLESLGYGQRFSIQTDKDMVRGTSRFIIR